MDPRKLQELAKTLNTFMKDEEFLTDAAIKIVWERIMSCIAQGREEEVKLAFPIRLELQNKIMKVMPSKLEVFEKNVQDLDDEMNKMLTSPDLSITEDQDGKNENTAKQQKAKSTLEEPLKSSTTSADAISLQDEIENKDQKIRVLQERVSNLEKKIVEKEGQEKCTCDKMVETETNETDLEKEIQNLKKTLKNKDDELKRYQTDIASLKQRISVVSVEALAGDENLVNLSDENRPVKLGERYSELYDNEWTDAFEVLTTELQYDDTAAIQKLIEILYDSYDYCEDLAKQHLQDIVERLVCPSGSQITEDEEIKLDKVSYNNLCDIRRSTGKYSVVRLQTMFIKYMEKNKPDVFKDETLSKVNPYIWKCVELCWYMVIQTPPVYINTKWKKLSGEVFNNEIFKFYAETGDKLDYIVWPPLYLRDGGALLCKGVAQPRGIL